MNIKSLIGGMLILATSVYSHAGRFERSGEQRDKLIKGASVWADPGDISKKDMVKGPGKKYAPGQNISCTFYDTYYKELQGTGKTAKFWCIEDGKDPETEAIKIKYGSGNGEIYGEVISSRLLWALGFYADKNYPITADCKNCPPDPWGYLNKMAEYKALENRNNDRADSRRDSLAQDLLRQQKIRKDLNEKSMKETGKPYAVHYDPAATETKFKGKAIYLKGQEKAGFGLNELGKIEESAGGSTRAQIDGLKLMLAFIKHSDNKPENQRFVCPDENAVLDEKGEMVDCKQAAVVIQDVGATMGNGATMALGFIGGIHAEAKVDLNSWKKTPVWRDRANCVTNLNKQFNGSMGDTKISEAGRKFLADLLSQLTDQQLLDLFTVAKVEARSGGQSKAQDWVTVFKAKRDEIVSAKCGE